MNDCNCHCQLPRDGTGQLARYLAALDPASTPIDGRSVEDLLVFAKRYAAKVRFYDIPGSTIPESSDPVHESRRVFFRQHPAMVEAAKPLEDPNKRKQSFELRRETLENHPSRESFKAVCDAVIGLLQVLDGWYSAVIKNYSPHDDLDHLISTQLAPSISKLPAYEAGYSSVDESHPLALDYSKIANKAVWGLGGTVIADPSVYQGPLFEDKIRFAGVHVEDVFYTLYSFLTDVIAMKEDDVASWAEFFRRDMAVIAASIGTVDLSKVREEYERTSDLLQSSPTYEEFKHLFDASLRMVVEIDHWYSVAIPANPLQADLSLAIGSYLAPALQTLLSYAEAYRYVDAKHPLVIDTSLIVNQEIWGLEKPIDPDTSVYTGETIEDKLRSASLFVETVFNAFFAFLTNLVEVKAPQYLDFALNEYPGHQPHMALFLAFLELFRLAQDQMNGLTERLLNFYYSDVLHLEMKPSVPDHVYVVFELAKGVAEYDLPVGTPLKAGKDASGKDMRYVTEADMVVHPAKVKELKSVFVQKSVGTATSPSMISGIFARPVANSGDGFGGAFADPSGKWPTFGTGLPVPHTPQNPCEVIDAQKALAFKPIEATVGFAIASPQLLLQGGNRLIAWHIPNLSKVVTDTTKPIQLWLTGQKGWIKITSQLDTSKTAAMQSALQGDFSALSGLASSYIVTKDASGNDVLLVYLPVAEQGVVAFDAKLHTGYTYTTQSPVMQMVLPDTLAIDASDYHSLTITGQSLEVRVGSMSTAGNENTLWLDGLKAVVLQNESGTLATNKPFDPFTAYPNVGKSFYIGSEEVFNKPLSELGINLKKTTDGDNAILPTSGDQWSATLSILQGKNWSALMPTSGVSFTRAMLASNVLTSGTGGATPPGAPVMMMSHEAGAAAVGGTLSLDLTRFRELIEPVREFSIDSSKGFIRITNALAVPAATGSSFFQRSQELAPSLQLAEVSLNYYASIDSLQSGVDQFFHVYPFGVAEITTAVNTFATAGSTAANAKLGLLPQFTFLSPTNAYDVAYARYTGGANTGTLGNKVGTRSDLLLTDILIESSGLRVSRGGAYNQYSGQIQQEGSLLIGVEQLNPLNSLSLLFQFAEGSAANEDDDPPDIHWSYLVGNEWRPLDNQYLLSDGTHGFQATGIVKFDVPADATLHHTIVTDGLIWLCASVEENTDRIPMLVNIIAQAVEAVFVDNNNDQSHFDAALPSGTISNLVTKVAEISSVTQPFASFDGKHREIGREYYARVSERLRHKARAITPKDYELLILDRFPNIFKVKCLTTADPNCFCRTSAPASPEQGDCCGPQVAPGNVLIVPIADLKNRNGTNPLQPKTSRVTLLEIEEYLAERTSPFVHVRAKNPVYEQILCFFRVEFIEGSDTGYYLKQLNEDLVHYLTPWAFDAEADVSFAQKIYASAIVNFIEERPYVDFITDFLMFVCCDECCPPKTTSPNDSGGTAAPTTLADALAGVQECCDVEALISRADNFIGEVIAEPCTPRSILVSAPQHIILPYIEPVPLTPCDKLAIRQMQPVQQVGMQRVAAIADTRAKEAVIAKKSAETVPVRVASAKPAAAVVSKARPAAKPAAKPTAKPKKTK